MKAQSRVAQQICLHVARHETPWKFCKFPRFFLSLFEIGMEKSAIEGTVSNAAFPFKEASRTVRFADYVQLQFLFLHCFAASSCLHWVITSSAGGFPTRLPTFRTGTCPLSTSTTTTCPGQRMSSFRCARGKRATTKVSLGDRAF